MARMPASARKGRKKGPATPAATKDSHMMVGTTTLLVADEEKDLARKVQQLLKLERTRDELVESLRRQPNVVEWAEAVGQPVSEFRPLLEQLYVAKDRMLMCNQRLVVSIVRKYMGCGIQQSDLVAEGLLGLLRGVEKFDPDRGFKFSTYAHWWIRQAITRAISENSRAVRVPVHMYEMQSKLRKAQAKFYEESNRMPTQDELAEAAGVTLDKLRKVEAAYSTNKSMDDLVAGSEGETLGDTVAESEESAVEAEEEYVSSGLQSDVEGVLDTLGKREAGIMRMRYGLNPEGREHTLEEIGARYNVTRERIRQLETKALRKLRQASRQTVLADYIKGPGEAQSRATATARASN